MGWLFKRWWFWSGTGFMLLALGAGYLLIPVERDRINKANYDKTQKGWSKTAVEELLGAPKYRLEGQIHVRWEGVWIPASAVLIWVSEDGEVDPILRTTE